MNCPITRRRLLAQEQPDLLDANAEAHLASCPPCRAWHRRLLTVERNLARLPVPPSTARDRLLAQVLAAPVPQMPPPLAVPVAEGNRTTPRPVTPTASRSNPWTSSPREKARQKLALALSIAATLLLFAIGFWAWPWHSGTPAEKPGPYAELELKRDKLLATARSPQEKVRSLAKMADEVWREARNADADRLAVLSRFYGQLVRKDLLDQARTVPIEERAEVLREIRMQLERAESEILRMKTENRIRAEAAAHLEAIALASRESNVDLGKLL